MNNSGPIAGDRFIREAEEHHRSGLSRVQRYEMRKKGIYPPKRTIPGTTSAKGVLESEFERWMRGEWPPTNQLCAEGS